MKEKIIDAIKNKQGQCNSVTIASLITNAITLAAFCTISEVLAKYQGTDKFVHWALFATIIVLLLLFGKSSGTLSA